MSEPAPWTIYTDGAARGNPGPAAFAYVIERPGDSTFEAAGCLGATTNNIAEYTALVRALEQALDLGGRRLVVLSDSELMVKQMNGDYKVKHPGLWPLYQQAKTLERAFEHVAYRHIPREQNKRADELGNAALDGAKKVAAPVPKPKKPSQATRTAKAEAVREQAVECLRSAAAAWARGNAGDPPPDAVWEQLWDILRQEGVLV